MFRLQDLRVPLRRIIAICPLHQIEAELSHKSVVSNSILVFLKSFFGSQASAPDINARLPWKELWIPRGKAMIAQHRGVKANNMDPMK